MEPHEKLEQSKIAKTKGTQFFKVSYIMNEKYLFDHPISNRILFSKFAKKSVNSPIIYCETGGELQSSPEVL